MKRKVQIVRGWLVLVAALVAMVFAPDAAWLLPIAYFTGQANCFCCGESVCPTKCSAPFAPNQLTCVIEGITNGSCSSCTNYNTTFITTVFGPDSCDGAVILGTSHCRNSGSTVDGATHAYVLSAGETFLDVELGIRLTDLTVDIISWRESLGTAPASCAVNELELPYDSAGSSPDTICVGASSTCTATIS